MQAHLIIILLLSSFRLKTIAQTTHTITWDRFWLEQHYNDSDLTITVRLGDTFMFLCQITDDEREGDRHENLIRVSDQQDVEECSTTQERASFFGACTINGFDIMIPITNSLSLANRERFEAGQVYYFTSFSDGTRDSAENEMVVEGGACSSQPPLRLTASIAPTTSSVSMTSTTSSSSTSSVTRKTSSVVQTPVTVTTTASTSSSVAKPSPSAKQESVIGAAGQIVPLHFVVLLFVIVCLIFN